MMASSNGMESMMSQESEFVKQTKPKLLFLCQNLPFPPDGGALIRSYHTMRLLSERYEVTALCFFRKASLADSDAVSRGRQGLTRLARTVEVFPIPQETSGLRLFLDHARSLLGRRAYTRWTYESREFRRRVELLIEENAFDIVHLDSLDLVGYLPALSGQRISVAHHNVESRLLHHRGKAEKGLRGFYLRLQARLTEGEERRWCPRVDLNIAVSDEDRESLEAIAPGSKVIVAPNGVDTQAFQPSDEVPENEIVFVGGYTWFPNRDGMEYFAKEILPSIRKYHPSVPITWVGRAPDDVIHRMSHIGIHMTGYVKDIRPFVARAKCFIVPLRVGGGTRLKILDAWSLGKAIVSTSAGCEGLAVETGSNILVADSTADFAACVSRVLNDDTLRERLERNGRQTVEAHYDWTIVGEIMGHSYRNIHRSTTT